MLISTPPPSFHPFRIETLSTHPSIHDPSSLNLLCRDKKSHLLESERISREMERISISILWRQFKKETPHLPPKHSVCMCVELHHEDLEHKLFKDAESSSRMKQTFPIMRRSHGDSWSPPLMTQVSHCTGACEKALPRRQKLKEENGVFKKVSID